MEQKTIPQLMKEMGELASAKQQILNRETDLKSQLYDAMRKQKINKLENPCIRVSIVERFTRSRVDADKLKTVYPEIAKECIRESTVEPFVKVVVK